MSKASNKYPPSENTSSSSFDSRATNEPKLNQTSQDISCGDVQFLEVLLEEYRQIRAEINLKQGHTTTIINFAILIAIGSVGAIGSAQSIGALQLYVMLIAPVLLGNLGLIFAYEVTHIVVASGYIHNNIRKRINKLFPNIPDEDVIPWEDYKQNNYSKLGILFDLGRWLAFLMPSILLLAGYRIHASTKGVLGGEVLFYSAAIINIWVLFLFLYRIIYKRLIYKSGRI